MKSLLEISNLTTPDPKWVAGSVLQRKKGVGAEPRQTPPIVRDVLRSPGRLLDEGSRTFMEARFGQDFSRVRVHTDSRAMESAEAIDARAYTAGRDVVFGPGQLAPDTHEGMRLLAHELTHVVQQEGHPGSPSSNASTEAEARDNSHRVVAGLPARVESGAPAGALQRQGKTSGGVSTDRGFEKKTDEPAATNKFSYEAFVKLPVLPNGEIGHFSFLESLKLTNKGSKESEEPIPMSFTGLSSLQTSAALRLISFELPPLQLPKSIGELSLEGSLAGGGALKRSFGTSNVSSQELSTTANVEGGFKSSPLLSPHLGKLTVGASLGTTGFLKQKFGGKAPGFAPSASAELGFTADYLSPRKKSGWVTFGGILGEKGQLSLGAKGGLEGATGSQDGRSLKPSGSLELGFLGQERDGVKPFVKLKVSGEAEIDLKNGGIKDKSKSVSLGITAGVSF